MPKQVKKEKDIFSKIALLIEQSRSKIASTINEEMIILYWNIGKIIKENIMESDRGKYGKKIVQSLSDNLTLKYGKGYSPPNLWFMVQFFETSPILYSLRREFKNLSWTQKKRCQAKINRYG
jgi:hypothetical protein